MTLTLFLDLYLNGKLVRTCVLPGVPKMNPASAVVLCPNGGFAGYISKFETSTQLVHQACNIYKVDLAVVHLQTISLINIV